MKVFNDERDWFFKARFGLFIHFGLYAIDGWHEQDQMRRRIPRERYQKLMHRFNPSSFDPDGILDTAESAGMKYLCLTTKHHDGFCMWKTQTTDFNIMNSPYGKDIVGQLADACRRRDFRLGLYYSIVDWNHPNYPNLGRHHELACPERGDVPDWDRYMAYLREQVRELCSNYGKISHFFWDMNVPKYRDSSVNDMIRKLQPEAVINDRGFDDGDFGTPEREYNNSETDRIVRFPRPTEACNSVGTQSWGYRKGEDYYSIVFLVNSIDSVLAKGGNYLLNVGPDAKGRIPAKALKILKAIGAWYGRVGESFCDTEPASDLVSNRDLFLTKRGNCIYVHIKSPARAESVVLAPISQKPVRALLLNNGKILRTSLELLPVQWQSGARYLIIKDIPADRMAGETMVLRLDFEYDIGCEIHKPIDEFKG